MYSLSIVLLRTIVWLHIIIRSIPCIESFTVVRFAQDNSQRHCKKSNSLKSKASSHLESKICSRSLKVLCCLNLETQVVHKGTPCHFRMLVISLRLWHDEHVFFAGGLGLTMVWGTIALTTKTLI
mmetsp:Transcript_16999/g.56256  ORF Transcript_16999/g.56256 Transcript_16999/m.56256 type:complete len:125 (-) Transcript_16999:67-441(-)